jgi:tyrosyl-tRNA synthetase
VYAFYQFWLNVDDESVGELLRIYTLLGREEIEQLESQTKENPGARAAQKRLAESVTTIVHGQERTESVQRVTDVLFGQAEFSNLSGGDIEILGAEIPTSSIGKTVVDVLVESSVATSNGDARRLIESGAVSVNGEKATHDSVVESASLIKKGKNNFVLVR